MNLNNNNGMKGVQDERMAKSNFLTYFSSIGYTSIGKEVYLPYLCPHPLALYA